MYSLSGVCGEDEIWNMVVAEDVSNRALQRETVGAQMGFNIFNAVTISSQ